MSSKIEVPVDSLDRFLRLMGTTEGRRTIRKEIADLIATPVVERQPVATVVDFGNREGWIPQGIVLQWCSGIDHKQYVGARLYTDPPELAELQVTIARLTAENERLKGGRESLPVAALEKARDVLRSIIRDRAAGVHYASAQAACHQINQALEQPAPVSVVPEGWKIVPIRPTLEMMKAGHKKMPSANSYGVYGEIYIGMIESVPSKPQQQIKTRRES